MKKVVIFQLLAGLAALLCLSEANAQTNPIVSDLSQSEEFLMICKAIGITDYESPVFLPVYQQYTKELNALKSKNAAFVLISYRDHVVSDDEAWLGLDEYVRFEQNKAYLKKRFSDKFRKVIPPKKAAMFFILESKLDAISNYDLAELASFNEMARK